MEDKHHLLTASSLTPLSLPAISFFASLAIFSAWPSLASSF